MGFNLHRRRVSGILVVLLVVTGVSTVGPAQPAQAAVSVVPESASIDLGAGWGSLIGGGTRVDNVGDPVTFGTVSVTAGFVISYDTCSGESLASGGSCWVSASPADQAIGRRTGTISIHDDGGAVVASIAVQATLFDGVVAFGGTGGYVDRGESFHFNRDNSTLTITDSFGSLIFHGWQAGPMTGSVSISEPDLQLFDPDTRYEGTGLTGNAGLRVSVDGRGCQQEGGTIDIDEVEYELDGSLRRMLASFSAPCGGGEEVTAGIIAVSSTPFAPGLWMPPAQRLAAFAGPTEGVPLFATNLAAVASGPVVADTTAMGPHEVLADGCSGVSLASFEPCEIRIGPGAAPGTGLTGVLGVSDGGSTAQSLVDSDRNTVTYATTLQFAGPDGAVTTRNVTTHLVDDVSIHSFDNAAVELRVDGRTVLEIAAPTGQSLATQTYANIDTDRNASAQFEADNCRPTGGSLTVENIEFDGDELTRLGATFDLMGCGGSFTGSIWINTAPPEPHVITTVETASFNRRSGPADGTRFEIVNAGGVAAPMSVEITGWDRHAFWISENSCGSALGAGERCSVVVNYTPMGRPSGESATYLTIDDGRGKRIDVVRIFTSTPDSWQFGEGTPADVESGYWLLEANGSVHSFGDARHMGDAVLLGNAAAIVPTPSGRGYWVLDSAGTVSEHGDAAHFGELTPSDRAGLLPGEEVTSMAATPTSQGYWIFTTRGRVFRFGDAPYIGDLLDLDLQAQVIDATTSPTGAGAYMLAEDGGVFAMGDARFAGSVPGVLPGVALDEPTVGIVPDPDGSGYWIVAADGGVFAFEAPYRGSIPAVLPGVKLDRPVNGMVPYGNGYLLVARDGGAFNFSNLDFDGSLGGQGIDSVVGIGPVVIGGGDYR